MKNTRFMLSLLFVLFLSVNSAFGMTKNTIIEYVAKPAFKVLTSKYFGYVACIGGTALVTRYFCNSSKNKEYFSNLSKNKEYIKLKNEHKKIILKKDKEYKNTSKKYSRLLNEYGRLDKENKILTKKIKEKIEKKLLV